MTTHALMSTLAATLVLGGCAPKPEDVANGDDPIKALTVSVRSTRYEGPYWSEQRRMRSATWQQAVAYCTPDRVREHPNCEPVVANAAAERGNARADSALRAIGKAAKQPIR